MLFLQTARPLRVALIPVRARQRQHPRAQVTAAVHQLAPELAGFPPAVVGVVVAETQQNGQRRTENGQGDADAQINIHRRCVQHRYHQNAGHRKAHIRPGVADNQPDVKMVAGNHGVGKVEKESVA